MLRKQLHPDAVDGAAAPAKIKSKKSKGYTPTKDSDFDTVCNAVSTAWAANPTITLIWKTPAQFAAMVTAYSTAFGSRLSDGGNRPSQTQTLEQLDEQMDEAVTDVKTYIEKKFKKKNAPAQFARYGIVHTTRGYTLPKDRDQRKLNLQLMIDAIAEDGFDTEEFGATFWTTMQTNYTKALNDASTTDGSVSTNVAAKNEQKAAITKVMDALRLVLKGNYPDTYAAVYRDWGWQKEDY